MKTLKTLAALSFALSAFASLSAHAATTGHHAMPPSFKVCNPDGSCQSSNGPSLDGLVIIVPRVTPPGIKTCNQDTTCSSPNGPSLDGIVDTDQVVKKAGGKTAPGVKVCTEDGTCQNTNGPSLDGIARAPSIKGCPKGNMDCGDVNGPSLDGLVVIVPRVTPPSVKGCPKGNVDCGDVNGPRLDGFVEGEQVVHETLRK